MRLLLVAILAFSFSACKKKAPEAIPVAECKQQVEQAYAKGINDSFGFITKIRESGTAKAGDFDIQIKGASASEIAACVTCGNMIFREGLKIIRREATPAATPVTPK